MDGGKKENDGYGSSRLPFKIGKPQREKYPEYLKGESGAHASHQSEQGEHGKIAFPWVWSI